MVLPLPWEISQGETHRPQRRVSWYSWYIYRYLHSFIAPKKHSVGHTWRFTMTRFFTINDEKGVTWDSVPGLVKTWVEPLKKPWFVWWRGGFYHEGCCMAHFKCIHFEQQIHGVTESKSQSVHGSELPSDYRVEKRCPARPHPQQQNFMSLTQTPPLLRRLPPPLTALTNHSHWHFRGQCCGSKIVRISPNQLSSHSCHTTHCPWTRTYPRLRLGGGDRLEEIATQEVKLTKRYTT